jgi:hypothetical protein
MIKEINRVARQMMGGQAVEIWQGVGGWPKSPQAATD